MNPDDEINDCFSYLKTVAKKLKCDIKLDNPGFLYDKMSMMVKRQVGNKKYPCPCKIIDPSNPKVSMCPCADSKNDIKNDGSCYCGIFIRRE